MDFERKPEITELLAHEKVTHEIVEHELMPAVQQFTEPKLGPVEANGPEKDKAPDASALAAWIDDLSEYGDSHRGEPAATELLDKLTNHALDDLAETARGHHKGDVDADIEQTQGFVNDFHADSAIEGAAVTVPERHAELPLSQPQGHVIEAVDAGGGDDDGSGSGQPGDPSEGDDQGGVPPDDPKAKTRAPKKKRDGDR